MRALGDVLGRIAGVLLLVGPVAIAAATTVSGCQEQRVIGVPFETIEGENAAGTGEYYEAKEPKLLIITEAADIDLIGNTVSRNAQAQLRNLDFDQYFAIAVFQGWEPYWPDPSSIEVQRISKRGITITIHIHIDALSRSGEVELRAMVASPYHLVQIRKGEDMQGEFQFILDVDGAMVSQQTHRLP
jgi:hypothetical protein